jgi:hypothetical protein
MQDDMHTGRITFGPADSHPSQPECKQVTIPGSGVMLPQHLDLRPRGATVFGVPLDDYHDWMARTAYECNPASTIDRRAQLYAGAQVIKVVSELRKRGWFPEGGKQDSPTPPAANLAPPTFDDWFKARNDGMSFDALHFQGGMMIADTMRTLARELRDYTTEMAQRAAEKGNG